VISAVAGYAPFKTKKQRTDPVKKKKEPNQLGETFITAEKEPQEKVPAERFCSRNHHPSREKKDRKGTEKNQREHEKGDAHIYHYWDGQKKGGNDITRIVSKVVGTGKRFESSCSLLTFAKKKGTGRGTTLPHRSAKGVRKNLFRAHATGLGVV